MESRKRKRLYWIAGIAAAVLIIALVIARRQGLIGEPDQTQVSVEKAEKRTIVETVSANGKIQPEAEVKVSPDVSGEVVQLYVKEGETVKAGQLLARIDPKIYSSNYDRIVASHNSVRANLSNAQARLAQVQAQFVNAQTAYNRAQQLFNDKAISAAEYDNAKSQYEVARAEVTAAQQSVRSADYNVKSSAASVKEAGENLYKTNIYAPVGGTISKLNVEMGERVAGASQFSAGTEILRIANLDVMEVNVSVNENDIVRVTLNDTALVEVDSYLNRKFKGVVTEIATSANLTGTSADQVTNFNVKIRLIPESYQDLAEKLSPGMSPFRPGMSATVDIQTETTGSVLTVPIQSVTTRSDSTRMKMADEKDKMKTEEEIKKEEEKVKEEQQKIEEIVFLIRDGKVVAQKVKTGIQDNMYIYIREGLKEGDEVVTGPYRAISKTLRDGDAVKVVAKEELFKKK